MSVSSWTVHSTPYMNLLGKSIQCFIPTCQGQSKYINVRRHVKLQEDEGEKLDSETVAEKNQCGGITKKERLVPSIGQPGTCREAQVKANGCDDLKNDYTTTDLQFATRIDT
ncbi:hypothetical protein HYALB_00006522 [Hymenoscyphus albidus]|uniref:Uncharacterized protein n=1 Tax=Hymenoscyphus albidus TaxID=595503 RepID=A0A9N9LIN9_9HELO|nr:hypothetical protein HYALB_00006522 [Hymenoscyphus albidus]